MSNITRTEIIKNLEDNNCIGKQYYQYQILIAYGITNN